MRVRPFAFAWFEPLSFSTSCLTAILVFSSATSAAAQSPYVGAAVIADVVRSSGSRDQQPGSGETIGGALRVGTSLGPRWGVDLEFVRSGETDWRPDVTILAGLPRGVPDAFFGPVPDLAIFPTPNIEVESQLSTLTASLWFRQNVSDRFSLVYLGGVVFSRTEAETQIEYGPIGLPRGGPTVPTRLYSNEAVLYDTGVSVGLDGDIEMTDHLRLVPGLRMLAIESQWLLRPSVGLRWRF
jgi:hypothetical protein